MKILITGDNVAVISSPELNKLKLDVFAGRTGVITQVLMEDSRKNKGYIVRMHGFDEEDSEWYFPYQSILKL